MTTEQQISYFQNIFESELEEIIYELNQNTEDKNIFLLRFFNSFYELYDSIFILLEKKSIESSGIIISSLWERNLTQEYIYLKFEKRLIEFNNHNKLKKTPWKVYQMVKEITDLQNHPTLSDNVKFSLYYQQYSFLCAIKHGNPFTFNYLNRKEINSIIGIKTFDLADYDLIIYMKLLTLNITFEFITNYYNFNKIEEKIRLFKKVDLAFLNFTKNLDLNVPQIISADSSEYDEEIWNYFDSI